MTRADARFLANRLLNLTVVWLGISLLAFALSNLAPGDPAQIILQRQTGEVPSQEAVERLREELGLNDPFPLRYARWLGNALRGELGTSYRTSEPVFDAMVDRLPATLELAFLALLLALALAIPLGVVSAVRRNSPVDHASRLLALLGASVPSFWLGYMLILAFAVWLGLLPVAGRNEWRHAVLPAITLGLGAAASLMRLTRASMLDVLEDDYVRTARAKGLRERLVVMRHGLRNALNPIVTLSGLRFGWLLGGAVIVETVFAWPGIGTFVVDSIYDRDYPSIQGFVLFMGSIFVVVNFAVDVGYRFLDPRVRLGAGHAAKPEPAAAS